MVSLTHTQTLNTQSKDNNMKYDSGPDTVKHIARVREHLETVRAELKHRALMHDWTKLHDPEKAAFDSASALKDLKYGTPEYDAAKKNLGAALDHHYKSHKHHPEHYPNGINDMSIIDIIEMLCDWKAATERMKDGNMQESLEINRVRFNIDDQLYAVIINTARELKFI